LLVRRLPDPGLLGQDRAASPEPRWQPPSQHRHVPHRVARLRWHQPTRDYMARRIAEGKTKTEAIRCLKRYVAREVFAVLNSLAFDLASAA
jgi:hypothetical protein